MVVVAIWSFVIALVGLLMYAFCKEPRLSKIGFVLFCIGAFFVVAALSGQVVHLPMK